MIGQEGTMEQLNRSTVNLPAPTMEQINRSTAPIREVIDKAKTKVKDVIEDIKKGTLTLFTVVVIGAIFYLIATNKK